MKTIPFSIYDASAGSGKTFTLTKEYLKILFLSHENDAYKRILAITFTNKAVEEMKLRVVNSLYEFSLDTTSAKAEDFLTILASETKLSKTTIKDKSKAIIKSIIHNYTAFGISTIDKFTLKVIRTFTNDLHLPPNFEVALDTQSLLQEAVDAVIAKVGEDKNITNLLIDFTKSKTDDDKNWDITNELFEIAKLLANENNANELLGFKEKSFEDFAEIKKVLRDKINELEKFCIDESEKQLQFIDANCAPNSFYSSYVPKFYQKIITKKFEKSDTVLNYLESPENRYAKKVSQADKDFIDANAQLFYDSIEKIYYSINKMNFYDAFLQNINPLSLLNTINVEFKKIQEEQNVLSISDFNKIISEHIKNQPAPFIYERLGERFRHFFIDEFQDTSVLQWHNLIPLIENALYSSENDKSGTLMLVGDPKQSIYRWRGGKAEQFIGLTNKENPFPLVEKGVFRLEKNYRSFSEVVHFNNNFFAHLSHKFENESYADLYLNKSHQEVNAKEGGYVNISFINQKDDEFEIDEEASFSVKNQMYLERTKQIIEKVIIDGFQYKDMVLLTRRKADGVALANYLTENGIPIISSETLLIQNATEVKLIIDLLRYLKNNKDVDSKVKFLYFIAKYNQSSLAIYDFISQTKDLSEEDLETYLLKMGITISFKNCKKKSLYEIVETIALSFIKEKANTSYVQYFMDLVLEREIKYQSGISDFLEYWDKTGFQKSIPSPDGNDAVKIMTIHKSKGLEFPVVIYPFAEEDFAKKPKDKLWVNFDDDETIDFPKALVASKKEVVDYGIYANQTYQEKAQEEILDIINVLYVVLTRAEEQLYIVSNQLMNKKGLPNNLSSYFIEYLQFLGKYEEDKLEYEFGNPNRISKKEKEITEQPKITLVKDIFDPKNIKIAKREALMWNTDQLQAIEFGNIMHEIMAFISYEEDIENAICKAVALGIITESQKPLFHKNALQIVTNTQLEAFFAKQNKVLNEQTILSKDFGNLKPDRIAFQGNNAFLLDYKTGVISEKHKFQLENYAAVLEKMNYKIVKKALVYIGETIEIVFL